MTLIAGRWSVTAPATPCAPALETIMANHPTPWRVAAFTVLTSIFHFATALSFGLREFCRLATEFIIWGATRLFPDTKPITEAALYEVGRARAVAYADTRRASFDRRHVDQGWLAAA